ncbi:MAG: von Willebrand factor type A domain-containing protein, partial [Monoraphidium minutum]
MHPQGGGYAGAPPHGGGPGGGGYPPGPPQQPHNGGAPSYGYAPSYGAGGVAPPPQPLSGSTQYGAPQGAYSHAHNSGGGYHNGGGYNHNSGGYNHNSGGGYNGGGYTAGYGGGGGGGYTHGHSIDSGVSDAGLPAPVSFPATASQPASTLSGNSNATLMYGGVPPPSSAPNGGAGGAGFAPPPSVASSTATYAFGARPKALPPPSQAMSSGPPPSAAGGGSGPPPSAASGGGPAAGGRPPAERARLGPRLEATCPMVCLARTVGGARDALPLQVNNLQFDALVYVSQAFVQVQMMCHYPKDYPDTLPLMIFIPKQTDTTITDLAVENQTRGCIYSTAVVPKDDTSRFGGDGGGKAPAGGGLQQELLTRDPELFMLFLPPGLPGDNFKVTFSYLQPLSFEAGRYVLELPARIPDTCLPPGSTVNGVLDVTLTINSGAPGPVEWLTTHPTSVLQQQPGSVALTLDRSQPWASDDVVASYSVWRNAMTATLHVAPPASGDAAAAAIDPRGSFCMMVSPPGPECSVPFSRSAVFLFDRSGSMAGEPLRAAKAALAAGLALLGPGDEFTVVAFDHEQEWWTDGLNAATPDNVAACQQWVADHVTARGTTNIMAPLQRAMRMLQGQSPMGKGAVRGLPFIFLITDGCVENERDICKYVESASLGVAPPDAGPPLLTATTQSAYYDASSSVTGSYYDPQSAYYEASSSVMGSYYDPQAPTSGSVYSQPAGPAPGGRGPPQPRVFTFGIGPYCNHYFLRQLAAVGRGMSDAALRPGAIQGRMGRMLVAAALPLLSDVTLQVTGVPSCELFPAVIPDLFCGQPLL